MSFGTVSKSLFASKTFWACLVGLAAEVATALGVHVLDDPATQAEIVGMITAAAATFFRHTATQPTHIAAPVLLLFAAMLGLAGCGQTAAPAGQVAQACDAFRRAETDPLVQLALAGGTIAADAAMTKGAAAAGVALVKSYGDKFCAEGPPAGDTTSPAQQAAWLAELTMKLLAAAGGVPH